MGEWHPKLEYIDDLSIYDLYPERWLALDLDWKGKPIANYRNSTDRIVQLRVKN